MPLTPTQIKVKILENGDTVAGLAREWGTWREVLSAVIHRRPGVVHQELRQKLADYLQVDVSCVGNEPLRREVKAEEPAEVAA